MRYWDKGEKLNNGKYIVEQILGSGGFGVTYRIRQTKNNKLFALKTLNLEAQAKPDFQQLQTKFINEAIALASCRHPNIVRVYPQGFQEDNLWCMVMEYVEGEDLSRYLDRSGKLEESQAVKIITKVGEALHFVHQQELLHRDIKPANILLRNSDSKPVLIDFGLAREYTHGQSIVSMTSSRTLSFAPPEQFQERGNFGAWTDVYALAATLYVLLTNELPIPALFRQHADLKPPQEFNSNISDRINQAILKGMAMETGDRPHSVEEWLDILSVSEQKNLDFCDKGFLDTNYKIYELININSDFRVTKIIYSTCFKAYEADTNTPVIIKTNGTKKHKTEEGSNNFSLIERISRNTNTHFLNPVKLLKNEAQLLAKINQYNHPNIARYRHSFEEDNNFYFVLDEIKGEKLLDIVQQQGKLSKAKAIKYIKQIGSALITCHKNDICHGDVHPGNIIIDSKSDRAILIDFGVAANPENKSIVGNYWFQPKSRYGYEKETCKLADIYSLAATLYYLVTGQSPTNNGSWEDDDIWFSSENLIEPKRFNLELSEYLNFAILKGMDFAKERSQSVEEWLKLLNPSKKTGILRYAHHDRIIGERYQIIDSFSYNGRELGSFVAKDTKLDTLCLLKKIGLTSNWKKEVYILNRLTKRYHDLDYKRIQNLFEYFEELWCYYWIYEQIEGQSLDIAEIVEGERWQETNVINLLIEVLEIISFIHNKGYIHGAIKPSCLIRNTTDGAISITNVLDRRIIQFANCLDDNVEDEIFNSAEYPYKAPELMHGYIRPNSDIYSLGIIGIQAISGLEENDLWRIVNLDSGNHKYQNLVSGYSSELISIIEKMVDKDCDRRYQTASEVITDLNQIELVEERSFWRKLFD